MENHRRQYLLIGQPKVLYSRLLIQKEYFKTWCHYQSWKLTCDCLRKNKESFYLFFFHYNFQKKNRSIPRPPMNAREKWRDTTYYYYYYIYFFDFVCFVFCFGCEPIPKGQESYICEHPILLYIKCKMLHFEIIFILLRSLIKSWILSPSDRKLFTLLTFLRNKSTPNKTERKYPRSSLTFVSFGQIPMRWISG